ncbi:MAG: methyltransferase domain-containing protein [Pirellulaceae bacterium]|jgi:ubiquinone/menaquinone biosynthesis C-methylase UbiE|nr:class I SAM-dependent methyltransferase [Pirellulaceae bacterium]MDG2470961.1 methyltransferase domain-containing protein [Pirellulaceae bacterium]
MNPNPNWQLPTGVSHGTMEYFHSDSIAEDYDEYFEYTSLFSLDESILKEELRSVSQQGFVADFGCGTGRSLVSACELGFKGLAIDMSLPMLNIVQQKSLQHQFEISCVKANLVELNGFRDNIAEHGVCLFSTLGMIQGDNNRLAAMRHFRRLIKPGGKLILHVHNYWFNLYDPGGPKWMLHNAWQACRSSNIERGDRLYPYRGVYNMFLHVFTRSEIRNLTSRAGFQKIRFIPLNPVRMNRLSHGWWFSSLRCNGWIIVCE